MNFYKNKRQAASIARLLAFILFSKASVAQSKNYIIDSNILERPLSFTVGSISSVAVDKNDNIYIFHRGNKKWNRKYPESTELIKDPAILKYSKQGKLIDSFGANMFLMPHMINVDKDGNIWAVDVWLQQVIRFDKKGKVLLILGERFKRGTDSLHFDLPTDVAIANDKSFFVGDGYGNSRICNFSANGIWKHSWGKSGTGSGEFNNPHSIAIYKKKLFVADRENSRLQVFDLDGNFRDQWEAKLIAGRLFAVTVDRKGTLYITGTSGTFMISEKFEVLESWSEKGHDIAVDTKGTIYLSGAGAFKRITKSKLH